MSFEQLAGAWIWENYGKQLADLALDKLKSRWESFKWAEASERYCAHIQELHSTMRVLYKDETVDLDTLYVDLFVLDKKDALIKYQLDSLHLLDREKNIFRDQSRRTSALRIVTKHKHLFIFGKPGTGKTTLLKHLAIQAAKKRINKIPIYISFYSWAYSGKDLTSYISDQFEICGFPDPHNFLEALLGRGDALLLFDGLDEITEENRLQERIIREVEDLTNQYNKNSVCITCRNSGVNYQFERFVYVEIADFTKEQVRHFASKWFSNNPTKGNLFIEKLNERRNLIELSQNPLLLGLLCLIFNQYSRFPEKRIEIYRDAVDALITRWDSQKGVRRKKLFKGFTPILEKELLSLLALEFSLWNKFFFDEDDLVGKIVSYLKTSSVSSDDLDGLNLILSIESQHGLLIKRAHRVYSFPHLTFQEYFAALCVVNNQTDEVIKTIAKNISTPHWAEIVLIVFNLLPSVDDFFLKLVKITNRSNTTDGDKYVEWVNEIACQLPSYQESELKARKESIAIIVITEKILTLIEQLSSECESIIGNKIDQIRGNDFDYSDTADEQMNRILREIDSKENNLYKVSHELQKTAYSREFVIGQNPETRKRLRKTCEILDQGILINVCKRLDHSVSKGVAFTILSKNNQNLMNQILEAITKIHNPICFITDAEKQDLYISLFQIMAGDHKKVLKNYAHISPDYLERLLILNSYLEECVRQGKVLDKTLIESRLYLIED